MSPETTQVLGELAIWYVVFLFSLTVHEGAHALAAHLGGDDTALRGGQVTLNPIPHIMREPLGTVIMPVVSFLTGGWMMGWASTPFDPEWARRHPGRQAIMSLAGPIGNLSVAVAAFVVIKALLLSGTLTIPDRPGFSAIVAPAGEAVGGSPMAALALLLSVALNLNVLLGLFNLIPLPPLDGAGLVEGLFPRQADPVMRKLRAYPALALIGLLAAWKVFGFIAGPALTFVFRLVLALPVHA